MLRINKGRILLLCFMIFVMVTISGCIKRDGTLVSRYTYNESYQLNVPVKDGDCHDASVLLASDIKKAKEIAIKVLSNASSEIIKETDDYLQVRTGHPYRAILTVNLNEIESNKTFVTVSAKTIYVAGTEILPWACLAVDLIVKLSQKE